MAELSCKKCTVLSQVIEKLAEVFADSCRLLKEANEHIFNPKLNSWISVKDLLPEDGGVVLASFYAKRADQHVVRQLHYNYALKKWFNEDSEEVSQYSWTVTHWQPLPEPVTHE